jgi:hypothetical protein
MAYTVPETAVKYRVTEDMILEKLGKYLITIFNE